MAKQEPTHSLTRAPTSEMIPEELTYQAKLRAAMFDAVNPQDITDIVKNRIAKAKEGDKDALKFVTDYLLGANSGITFVQEHHYHAEPDDAPLTIERPKT